MITSVNWDGEYFNPPSQGTITGWTVNILADNAGAPGAIVNPTTTSGTAAETYLDSYNGYPNFSYSITLSQPFTALAGTTYWLSVVPDTAYPPQWGWAEGSGGNSSSYQDFYGDRTQNSVDMAFSLSGTAVPEPSTYIAGALLLLPAGLSAVRGLRRKKVV